MKARHIRRLRRKLGSVQIYKIRQTAGLFGDFFGFNWLGFTKVDWYVSASSQKRALTIFFRRYRQVYKQECEHIDCDTVTTESWGKIMIVDEKGFKTFYR